MALYDVYTTANVLGLITLGLPSATDRTVGDAGTQPGEATAVLGDVSNDSFVANDGLFGIDATHTYLGTINDANGNAIGFAGSVVGGLVYNLYVPAGTSAQGLTVTVLAPNANEPATQWDLTTGAPLCFLEGTLIRTPQGEVPVESLTAGDLVLTHDGRSLPVRWMGRSTVARAFADPLTVMPIRIKAGALGENVPSRDLLVSPTHAFLVDGVLVQANALVNNVSILREPSTPESFRYFHIELPEHAFVVAENAPAESFVDSQAHLRFDNWAEYEAMRAEHPAALEMPLPRLKSVRQLSQATRATLLNRAMAGMGQAEARAA